MSGKKKVLILCDSDLSREPRVLRQILALKSDYEIVTAGITPTEFGDIKHFNFIEESAGVPKHWQYPVPLRKAVSLSKQLYYRWRNLYKQFYFENEYWTVRRKDILSRLAKERFDVIIAHHWDTLPVAYQLGKVMSAKLIFNAHDYYPRQFEESPGWVSGMQPLINFVMDNYLPKFDFIFSAWTKTHEDFQQKYGVPSIIINNATEYNELLPQLGDASNTSIRIVHHGIANPNRKIEWMIEMMDYLDERFTLDFILVASVSHPDYYQRLTQLASGNPRIRFLDPVPTRGIAKAINQYDIGVFLLPPNGFNPTYLLPNKLFEFVQARLACLVSPSVEMKSIVEKYKLGWVAKEFTPLSLANEIRKISIGELNEKKNNAHQFAFELSAEKNFKKIKQTVGELTTGVRKPIKLAAQDAVS